MMFDVLWMAFRSLATTRLRSALTMLGVVIGITAVITLVAMGEAAKLYVNSQIQGWGVGTNTLQVAPGKSGVPVEAGKLTYRDIQAIEERCPSVRVAIPETFGAGTVYFGKHEYDTPFVYGTTTDYFTEVRHRVVRGRPFTRAEEMSHRRVALLGQTIVKELFGTIDPLGEEIKISGTKFRIIGIMEEKGTYFTFDYDDLVMIPIGAAERVLGTTDLAEIMVVARSDNLVSTAKEEITRLLIERHGQEDFHVNTMSNMLGILDNILNALTGVVGAIAAISLLVGGIGIMNIMLVAVAERTREIGIRKSVGASRRDIFWQFLAESVTVSSVGGVVGIVLGILLAGLILWALKLPLAIAPWSVGLAFAVAVAVGVFFGVYPAGRAAALNPIEALRYT